MTTVSSATTTWDTIYQSGRAVREWPSEDVVRFVARRLEPSAGAKVLDAGCGNGSNLWFLLSKDFETYGVDVSPVAIDAIGPMLARRLVSARDVRLQLGCAALGDIRSISRYRVGHGLTPWPSFDAIIDCRASQHMPWSQHETVYREYYDLLKPGGWLFLLHLDDTSDDARLPQNDHLQTAGEPFTWDDIVRGVYPGNGVVCLPPAGRLRHVVEDCGFDAVRQEILGRKAQDGQAAPWTYVSHVAIDARKPSTAE